MPANFSPTAQAARLLASRGGADRSSGHSAAPMNPGGPVVAGERRGEWPRGVSSHPPFTSIRRALLAIQGRHA